MKNYFLTAMLAIFGMSSTFAQIGIETVDIGVRAGYNHAGFTGTVPGGFEKGTIGGFHAGLFAEIPLSSRFSIQPEALYSTQGGTLTGSLAGESGTGEIRSQYFNIPILAKVYVFDGLNLQVGPQIGILMGATSEGSVNNGAVITNDQFHKEMNSFDFGAVVGAGYKLAQGLTIDARYNFGLTEVMKDVGSDGSVVENDWKNGVFSVGLGYQF